MNQALNHEQLASLRAQLDAREVQLRAEVRTLAQEAAEATPTTRIPREMVGDIGDQGEERMRDALRHAERERDVMELRQIADAKARMDQDRYGECIDCGQSIPLARLQAQPFSERCLACQQRFEKSRQTQAL
ncbi:TraR/DksA family transcriptional regulator [Variovorax sp. LARHSF232]